MKGNEMELAGQNGVALADTEAVKSRLVMVRGQAVLLDCDVAELYGVETRRVNEAVRNNPDKFPEGYVLVLDEQESKAVRSQNATSGKGAGRGRYSKFNFKAFTERGLYMLATILKGERAAKTTLAIIETYAQVRELARTMEALQGVKDGGEQQRALLHRTGGDSRPRGRGQPPDGDHGDGNRVQFRDCQNPPQDHPAQECRGRGSMTGGNGQTVLRCNDSTTPIHEVTR